jgi:hypothetical protein
MRDGFKAYFEVDFGRFLLLVVKQVVGFLQPLLVQPPLGRGVK